MTERDQAAINEAAKVAASVSQEGTRLLQACRAIVELQHHLGDVPSDILDPIRGVESELDNIPDDTDAFRWEPSAFDQMMRERDEYLEQVRPMLLTSFRKLHAYLERD